MTGDVSDAHEWDKISKVLCSHLIYHLSLHSSVISVSTSSLLLSAQTGNTRSKFTSSPRVTERAAALFSFRGLLKLIFFGAIIALVGVAARTYARQRGGLQVAGFELLNRAGGLSLQKKTGKTFWVRLGFRLLAMYLFAMFLWCNSLMEMEDVWCTPNCLNWCASPINILAGVYTNVHGITPPFFQRLPCFLRVQPQLEGIPSLGAFMSHCEVVNTIEESVHWILYHYFHSSTIIGHRSGCCGLRSDLHISPMIELHWFIRWSRRIPSSVFWPGEGFANIEQYPCREDGMHNPLCSVRKIRPPFHHRSDPRTYKIRDADGYRGRGVSSLL